MRRDHDPAWLEQQYDNRALVPDYASHLQKWAEASDWTRRHADAVLDQRYGDGANETLDLFRASAPNAPVLVFIHGGYWRALDKRDFSFVAPSFTAEGALVGTVHDDG